MVNDQLSRSKDSQLFILAFDHRGSFVKDLLGITAAPTVEQLEAIRDLKHLVFEGIQQAVAAGAKLAETGALVDEEYGGVVPAEVAATGYVLAMPVEKSGQAVFDFEYGTDYQAHIEKFDPDYTKVLVRYNPDGDAALNRIQLDRLAQLSSWLRDTSRKFLFELLVPATADQLASVAGSRDRYDSELRAGLMVRTIRELQRGGVEPDIWKIEGLEKTSDYLTVAAQCGADSRDLVRCVVLGRGADEAKVNEWLRAAAPVPAYIGFAIGRSIWMDALVAYRAGEIKRDEAAKGIAGKYQGFIDVFRQARTAAS